LGYNIVILLKIFWFSLKFDVILMALMAYFYKNNTWSTIDVESRWASTKVVYKKYIR
jgi:hypothetical protein